MDFDKLVLGPALGAFGKPVIVRPSASQPTASDYLAKGIFSQRPVEVSLEDGGVHSTVQTTLGIRLSMFTVPPIPDDFIQIGSIWYVVFDGNPDGQGGATLDLRQADPP